jgi:ribosomal protein S18 acetylase RimI-like enzyme
MIHLRKMTLQEFDVYLVEAIPSYARSKLKGEGLQEAEAMALASDSFHTLLPMGLETPHQYLFHVVDDRQQIIGTLWFAHRKHGSREQAYVYDIVLNEEHRGQGIGRKTMELLEKEVRKLGLKSIGLHVFGYNDVARGLYEKLGFRATNIIMVKDL